MRYHSAHVAASMPRSSGRRLDMSPWVYDWGPASFAVLASSCGSLGGKRLANLEVLGLVSLSLV